MVIVPPGADGTAECLLKHISDAIHHAYKSPASAVAFTPSPDLSPEDDKLLLDEQLNAGFNVGSRVAMVERLQELHGEAAMMMRSYCDNEYANFKDAHFAGDDDRGRGE
jgi:hypothetical protein